MRLRQRKPRDKSDGHLEFIRTLPCLVCKDNTGVDAAHIRMADLSVGKPFTGRGKPDDAYTVPLCRECHSDQHTCIEHLWWMNKGIDGIKVALALWKASGDYGQGVEIVEANRLPVAGS